VVLHWPFLPVGAVTLARMGADAVAATAELDLLRRRVLNVIGHELRTPVTTLSGLIGELSKWPDGPVRDELMVAAARNASRLDRLIEDLLLAASIETLVPVGAPEPVDLIVMARDAWKLGGHVLVEATFAGHAMASARPAAVERTVTALLENAAVHGEGPVTVVAAVDGRRASLEVGNGGPPLSDDDLALACEPFFRGERAVTTRPGLGLGLAVARTLARADNGDIQLRSGPTGGVVVRYELPAA
jgi:two-component system phosphate regulon sensor histidine kinase PhoR